MRFVVQDWIRGGTGDKDLPGLLRRRVTPMGQQALQAAWGLPDVANARFVLSSRHGEYSRTLSLLQSLAAKEEVSPADFSLSVHHALTGLLSIALQNRRGHIAVASGSESFCFGLTEAVMCLHENPNENVIFIHMDAALSDIYAPFAAGMENPIACAFALSATGKDAFSMHSTPGKTATSSASHAADFIEFLQGNLAEASSSGERHNWHWTRHV